MSCRFPLITLLGLLSLSAAIEAKDFGADFIEVDYIDVEAREVRNLSDTRYFLWTRSNPQDDAFYEVEWLDNDSLNNSPFNGSKYTYIHYHGFGSTAFTEWILEAKTEMLLYQDCNVFSVDYSNVSVFPYYVEGVDYMYEVANYSAVFIEWLMQMTPLTLSQVHILGQSLGAQAAGMNGQYMRSGKVARVTGLDPAGPYFENATDDRRLSKEDAVFVDVIHTNGGKLNEGCFGIWEACGHVDFYPNGGKHQPGCPANYNDTYWLDLIEDCSHARVKDLWIESIRGTFDDNGTLVPFTSWPCDSYETFAAGGCPDCGQGCLDMGLHVERNLEGLYYLNTNYESPYALGDRQNLNSSSSSVH